MTKKILDIVYCYELSRTHGYVPSDLKEVKSLKNEVRDKKFLKVTQETLDRYGGNSTSEIADRLIDTILEEA